MTPDPSAGTDCLVNAYPNRGLSFVRGEGHYLITADGERYLDLGSNYGVNLFGYTQDRITHALQQQLNALVNLHGSFHSPVRSTAAQRLVNCCGGQMRRVFFSNSGSEAIEAALKFARLATGKIRFVAMRNGYHGKTLGALSATSGDKYRSPFLPLLWDFVHVEYGCEDELRRAATAETAAILLEPVQGEGGIRMAPHGYYSAVQELCRERGILLIVDEIQTGLGRTGAFLASEPLGLDPDILCLGKGLAGGIPIGATLVSESVARSIPLHSHTSTCGGNPLAAAGVCATLNELFQPGLMDHVREVGYQFLQGLKAIHHPTIVGVRGFGLMLALELTGAVTPLLRSLQRKQIIAIPAGACTLRFLPPLTLQEGEVDYALQALQQLITEGGENV
jgi:acetylornithine/LysW-gamma-L-lysine aminotransferase